MAEELTLLLPLKVPPRLLAIVAQILRERDLPNDDGATEVAIMREQDCSVEDYTAAEECLYQFSRAVDEAARYQQSLGGR